MVDIRVRTAQSFDDLVAVGGLLDEVWGATTVPVLPMRVLRALAHSGAVITLAEDLHGPVGASVAFHGLRGSTRMLHSKVTGVLPRGRGRSVAVALKLDQRRRALDLGIELIEWTFDPLVIRNAIFNLNKLGGRISGYEPDFYGPMDDELNRGDASDRCVVDWWLRDPGVQAAVEALEHDRRRALPSVDAAVVLEDAGGMPTSAVEPPDAGAVLVAGPVDIESLRRHDADAAFAWRLAVRGQLAPRITAGWQVVAVRDASYLVVAPGFAPG